MANAGAIDTVLWPGCKAEVGDDLIFAGSYVPKTGYHNSRRNLQRDHPNDYSIQLDIDLQGPGDKGSAIDMTFKSAQGGDFRNIAKYSRRLFNAGVNKDPRAYPMREFYGNTDDDRDVEGWSYYRDAARSSDPSHLWHIHISVHRKYIDDANAMRSILAIWNGDDPTEEEDDMPTSQDIAKAVLAAKITSDDPAFNGWTVNHILDWSARNNRTLSRAVAALATGQKVAQADLDAIQAALEEHDQEPTP